MATTRSTTLPPATLATRRAVLNPHSAEYSLPVRLFLHATPPGGVHYALTSFWEERHGGRVQRTTIEKNLTLHFEWASAGQGHLTYLAALPTLRKPDPSAFEKAVLLLASLYQHLELDVSPTGQLLALRNYAAILATWQAVQQELMQRSGGEDDVTQQLLASVGALLQTPTSLLTSLGYDYAFGWLLPDFYGQRFESSWRYEQPRCFARFFAAADLWFTERLEVGSAPAVGQVALHLRGQLDTSRTDLLAVAEQIDAERAATGVEPPATTPAAVSANYEATYFLDQTTGWPMALDASVRCEAGTDYCKEYFFRLEQQPTL